MPTVSFTYSNDLTSVTAIPSGGTVVSATLYVADDTTTTFRDFRQGLNGDPPTPFWQPTALVAQQNGSYVGTVQIPATGWRGYYIEFEFDSGHVFCTEVRVVPTTLPYPDREFGDGGNDFTPPN